MSRRACSAVIGLCAAGQVAAGVAFYLRTSIADAAPFGLALCAGIALLSVLAIWQRGLARAAIAGNLLLAVLATLGVVPVVVGLITGAAEAALAWNAAAGATLAVVSAASAASLRWMPRQSCS
jgi:hypothetical protein